MWKPQEDYLEKLPNLTNVSEIHSSRRLFMRELDRDLWKLQKQDIRNAEILADNVGPSWRISDGVVKIDFSRSPSSSEEDFLFGAVSRLIPWRKGPFELPKIENRFGMEKQ